MKIEKTRLFVDTNDTSYRITFPPDGQILIQEIEGKDERGKPIWSKNINDMFTLSDAILDFGIDYVNFINQASQRYKSY